MGFADDLSRIEADLRAGRVDAARKRLKAVSLKNASITEKTRAASLARRAQLPQLSIKWLFASIYPDGRLDRECNASQLLEYGASLIAAGALMEGRRLLEVALERKEPHALMFLGFSYMREWDYAQGAAYLKRYLGERPPDAYLAIVAKVNLLASLIKTQPLDPETLSLAEEVKRVTEVNYKRLHFNALELSVQLHVAREDYERARQAAAGMAAIAPSEGTSEYLFWKKWVLILEYLSGGKQNGAILDDLVKLAEKYRHPETLRDAHLRWALHHGSRKLFEHVYRGTPHASFRRDAEREYRASFGAAFQPSDEIYFSSSSKGFHCETSLADDAIALNVGSGMVRKANARDWSPEFRTQLLSFKLLQILCNDFYQSKNLVELSAQLYEGSCFQPVYSMQRVVQLMRRANQSFEQLGIKGQVELRRNGCSLNLPGVVMIKNSQTVSLQKDEWKLFNTFDSQWTKYFTVKELSLETGASLRTISRYLESLLKNNEIIVVGRGPGTRYLRNPEKTASKKIDLG